jgi:hypothetical protein
MKLLAAGMSAVVAMIGPGFGRGSSEVLTPPMPKSSDFSARVDNPWYPLLPGSVYVYRGFKGRQPSRDVLTVTHRTTTIDGASCVVIQDRLYLNRHLGEKTIEWYGQDKQGNVWYFGENTEELDKTGRITTRSGSWRAGVDGARPGIYMYATPKVGQSARQEFYKGEAQDQFQVLSLHATVKVPYTTSTQGLLTKEWSPLEPGVLDHKIYLYGVGDVLEETMKGAPEKAVLVSFRKGR